VALGIAGKVSWNMEALQSVIVPAVTAVIVAYITARAASYSKDVIEERQKWRERIRELGIDAAKLIRAGRTQCADYQKVCSEFQLRLNPDCRYDSEILDSLNDAVSDANDSTAQKLLEQLSRVRTHKSA
jgi:hypothetical protein